MSHGERMRKMQDYINKLEQELKALRKENFALKSRQKPMVSDAFDRAEAERKAQQSKRLLFKKKF